MGRVFRRDQLVAGFREAFPTGGGDVAFDAGVGFDDYRDAPEGAVG